MIDSRYDQYERPGVNAMPIQPELIAIESVYRDICRLERERGDLSDFLDRGRPSPEKSTEAHASLTRIRGKLAGLSDRYLKELRRLRERPEILAHWVGMHVELYESLGDVESMDEGFNATRRYVIGEAIAKWRRILEGDDDPVEINGYFTPEIMRKIETLLT